MKKLILNLTGMGVALALVFASCQKEEVIKEEKVSKSIHNNGNSHAEKIRIVVGVKIVWDEWGRANHSCRKAGLCNVRIEEIEIDIGKSAPIIVGEDGNMYVEILIDDDLDFEGSSSDFHIDKDIFAQHEDEVYRIQAGVFKIDYELGKMGGYTIPVIK